MAIAFTLVDSWDDGRRIHVAGTNAASGNYATSGDTLDLTSIGALGVPSTKPPIQGTAWMDGLPGYGHIRLWHFPATAISGETLFLHRFGQTGCAGFVVAAGARYTRSDVKGSRGMSDYLVNAYWAHPVAISTAVIAVIIILIWMTGSGSRQRFIILKKTKETDQLARDISRIASALEKIAKQREIPTDYVGRPIPPGWEEMISSGEPVEEGPSAPVMAGNAAGAKSQDSLAAESNNAAAGPKRAGIANPSPGFVNPLGGTASLLGGKKKLDLPNPMYKPK